MSLVSVIVATYRRDDALKNALKSLAEQTHKDIEIILVNDNSNADWNEKVEKIVDDFKSSFPTVSLNSIVNQQNCGSAKTRNIGIEASSGDYITFLDDDDIYLPSKVEGQVAFMKERSLDYSITDLYLYNEQDKLVEKRERAYIKATDSASLLKYHLKHHLTGTDTMMFKREYLLGIGGFAPIDVGDEFYLMQRAIEGNGKFGYLSGCDLKAYVHTGNGGLSSGEGKINGENSLYEYKKTFFDKLDSKTKRYIRMRHYAVIAFAYLRMKKYGGFLGNSIKSFFCAPFSAIALFLGRK